MGGSGFDTILQEIHTQQILLEQLQKENRELHQQLSDLQAGKGIFLEINGHAIALNVLMGTLPSSQTTAMSTSEEHIASIQEEAIAAEHVQDITPEAANQQQQEEQHTPDPIVAERETSKEKEPQFTFLEEILLQEIESSLTAPIPTVQPANEEYEAPSAEEHKANLRRELMGSYLLE